MSRPPSETIDFQSRFVVTEQQITSQLGDESVILDLSDGIYYGLDPIGTRIWNLLESPRSVQDLCDQLQEEMTCSRTPAATR
jgi:hypothetical protein